MYSALDSSNFKVWISDAVKGEEYFCPRCGMRLITRKGRKRQHHFAHYSPAGADVRSECLDNWVYDKSEWHKKWQELFPVEYREVTVKDDTGRHMADVKIGTTVVEFQHDPISKKEFKKRNEFFIGAGNRVLWILDVSEKEKTDIRGGWLIHGLEAFEGVESLEKEGITLYLDTGWDTPDGVWKIKKVIKNGTQYYSFDNAVYSQKALSTALMKGEKKVYAKYFEKPVVKTSVPGMSPISELWRETYKYIIVENRGDQNRPKMIIFGKDGKMDTQNGQITGYYVEIPDPSNPKVFTKSQKKYIVWNADKPIWKLIIWKKDTARAVGGQTEIEL